VKVTIEATVLPALAIVVLSVPFAWHRIIDASEFMRDWRSDWAVLFDKSNFGVLRYAHFLALGYLAWVAVGPGGVRLRQGGWVGAGVILVSQVGQQSLAVFAASMVVARVLGAFLDLAGGGALAALVVNLAGFAIIMAVARLAAFMKARPWRTATTRVPVAEITAAQDMPYKAEVRT
jgi:hypothetical protein